MCERGVGGNQLGLQRCAQVVECLQSFVIAFGALQSQGEQITIGERAGIVASFIEREGVVGRLSVAPPG